MRYLSENGAYNLIKAALDSGAIQLRGSAEATTDEEVVTLAKRDATYLLTLLNRLEDEQLDDA